MGVKGDRSMISDNHSNNLFEAIHLLVISHNNSKYTTVIISELIPRLFLGYTNSSTFLDFAKSFEAEEKIEFW